MRWAVSCVPLVAGFAAPGNASARVEIQAVVKDFFGVDMFSHTWRALVEVTASWEDARLWDTNTSAFTLDCPDCPPAASAAWAERATAVAAASSGFLVAEDVARQVQWPPHFHFTNGRLLDEQVDLPVTVYGAPGGGFFPASAGDGGVCAAAAHL
mmetsp:Transcript_11714/g.26097  ORF Transcript_11714/g.26097 Transcript_11714/m.26097 type:complete len:155 (+) Transcript_11714:22-486(+)